MHKRPSLSEAISVLQSIRHISDDADSILTEYAELKSSGKEFIAARLVVEVVDFYYHATGVEQYG